MNQVRHVLVVGGVHGNELNGVYLVKNLAAKGGDLLRRSHLSASTLLANPEAIRLGRRYVDRDLNRCFDRQDLANAALDRYEQQLAKQIYGEIRSRQVDFLIDLHTTTAAMGLTLILSSDHPMNLAIAAYLSDLSPLVKVLLLSPESASNRLRGVCPLGFTLEAGAIPQGTLNAQLFFESQRLIGAVLDYWNRWNQGEPPPHPDHLTVYEHIQTLDFPRNDQGDVIAMVHGDRHGQDYTPLKPGEPLFTGFDGTVFPYQGNEMLYPVFVHESAYWEKGIAMYLTRQYRLSVAPAGDPDA